FLFSASNLPIVIQHNHYKKESNSNGKGYILVLADKTIKSGGQYTEVKQQYYDDPQDVFKYGLLKTTTETGTVSPAATFNSVTKNYYYILNINKTTKSFYSAVKLKSGQLKRSAMITTSLFTNQTIERTDAENKNTTRYHYDHWGRIIQVDSGADTAFSASKHYTYSISPGYIQLIITINNGLRKKIIFDGAGRQLKVFNEAIADTGKAIPGLWIPVKSRDYDSYGRITAEHAYYTDDSKQTHRLTTTFEYDALGRTYKVNLPDKETQVKMYDDPDRCTVSFTYDGQNNYSPVSIVHGNILDKPTEQMVLPAGFIHDYVSASSLCKISNTVPAARVSYAAYDGFGRKVSLIDLAGRKVTTMYDDAGRVATITDPTGKQFYNVYDFYGNIIQKWITPANSNSQYLLASAQYSISKELLWKAGEDGKKTSYTYMKDGQMATTVMPCGDVISWKYNVVGLPVSERVDGKESVHINYDPVTALPVKKRDITGITRWVYSDDGKVQKVFRMGENGYQNYYFSWQYDQNRRVISITDLSTNKTLTHYDLLGRIDSASYQQSNGKNKLLKMSVYDGFSREVKINYGSGMQRSVVYNEYGQTKNITDTLANKLLSAWQYSYDKEGNIVILMHKSGDNQQAILHYQYDRSNNLVTMNCSGSSGLPLCPRDTSFQGSGLKQPPVIISQNYSFNALNRMQQVKESLLNTSQKQMVSKIVDYSYGYQQAPLRLKQITTQWNDATPVTTDFVYDTTGNMVVDSEGNKISYNIFNQITKVITPDGKQTHYFYDSDGREVKETTGTGDSRDLFYVGGHLLNEEIKSLQQEVHTISYLGVGKALDGMIHEYYEQNYKGDVTGVLTKTDQDHYALSQQNIYSPYGMVWHTIKPTSALPWYQQTFIGFNGEQTDPDTGWQFLGVGHRTYNPDQRYFVSEDPAGDGYAFGCNNPIMNSDPTGNTPKWMGAAMHIMQYVGTLGMAAFHKRWANIIGTTLMGALALAGLGATIACAGITSPLLIGVSVGLTMDASVLSVAAAAVPTNRGLSIASAAVGGMAAAATFVMLGTTAVLGVSSLVAKANLSIDEGIDASVDVLEASASTEKDSAEPLQSEGSFITKNDSVNQYPSQDMPDAKYWIRNTVWTSDLNSYIRYEARIGESIFRIRNNASIQGIWSALCNSFS
ncbi:MAG: hypothetical protein OXC48_11010, partial [Endozoicomonadaceae bacterium]|nr:hypothetical protein [Endozoicomonadaceae bacterium]